MVWRLGFLLALAIPSLATAAQPSTTVTFNRDVAPIVFARCVVCHRPGGDAPFSLATFQDARRRAAQIAEVTRTRYMPPWKPEPGAGDFIGERRLTEREIGVFADWVASGTAEGEPAPLPSLPSAPDGWKVGTPDIVLTLPPFTLRPEGPDVFRNFVVPLGGERPRYVRALEFRPGNPAVHHANIRIDPTRASRALDEADPGAGYEGLILHSADYPDGHFLGWTPGQAAPVASPDLSWTLAPDSDLVIQLHLQPTGKPEPIGGKIALYLTDRPPARTPTIIRLGRQDLDIPPGDAAYEVSDSFTLPVDAEVHAIQPHSHYRARSVEAWATLPSGTRRPLIKIADWDFNWQDQYRYAAPFWLPAGTRLEMVYRFDNSRQNPRNPDATPQRVRWGWRSSDEMADVWIQVFTRSPADRTTLVRESGRKMAAEDVVGGEVLIAREPRHVSLRNDTALAYMTLGQPDRAATHFAAVTALQPTSATAHYNEGVALEAGKHLPEAAARYEAAIAIDPSYAAAYNNLGSVRAAQGDLSAATRAYRRAVEIDPHNADAQNNLGGLLVLSAPNEAVVHVQQALVASPAYPEAHFNLARAYTLLGRPREAIASYRAALAFRQDWLPSLVNLSWLLSAHPDASVRNPSEAIVLAERASALAPQEAAPLDALASALAAAGRYDDAVIKATAAKAAATRAGANSLAVEIETRLTLYRARTPFVVPD